MKVLGHRGAPREAPENTLESFAIAMAHGADGVELDVRLSADGEVVVFHDPTLERLAQREGRVRALDYEALRGVDLGGGARIPTLDAVLSQWRAKGLVNVEIKSDDVDGEALVAALARVLARNEGTDVIVSSFAQSLLLRFEALAPKVARGVLFGPGVDPEALPVDQRDVRAAAMHPFWIDATDERVAAWRAQGLAVNVWTVDDVVEARRLRAAGATSVISNVPGDILRGL